MHPYLDADVVKNYMDILALCVWWFGVTTRLISKCQKDMERANHGRKMHKETSRGIQRQLPRHDVGRGGVHLRALNAQLLDLKIGSKEVFLKKKKLPEVFVALESVRQTGVFSVRILLTVRKRLNMTLVARWQPHSNIWSLPLFDGSSSSETVSSHTSAVTASYFLRIGWNIRKGLWYSII